jgi:hypothetical protein
LNNNKKVCTSCGSDQLAGPFVTSSFLRYGTIHNAREKSFVCLDCGHVDNYCSDSNLDDIRKRAMQKQEKDDQKRYESM